MTDSILETITPTSHDLGSFKVHRALPARGRTMVGPFVFYDDAGPAVFEPSDGIDVRPHPHIGLATVSYLLEGRIMHRDSLGTEQVIEPGAVNLMTAGKGIVHSERTVEGDRDIETRLKLIQTWLALPDGQEEIDPAFEHVAKADLPIIDGDGAMARIIMGSLWGSRAPVTTYAETINADIQLDPGGSLPIDTDAEERALYMTSGDATLDGTPLDGQTLYVLKPGTAATLRSENGAQVMLCGGEAFTTKRHVYWNFVSSSKERISQAVEDWKAERFPVVPSDSEERIPMPGTPKTNSEA
ncbi:pirin family protein [Parasphingopyxis sp.]|uniref:pirin family protein n=1 Tax=Parasphingopyxis sp. TaxID=1920299 RepID=UPI002632983C|nr:pirin family protein [Parasphingopyxis sp.]